MKVILKWKKYFTSERSCVIFLLLHIDTSVLKIKKKLDENDLQKCLYFANGQNITTATAKNVYLKIYQKFNVYEYWKVSLNFAKLFLKGLMAVIAVYFKTTRTEMSVPEKQRNDISDIFTSENMENMSLVSWM